MSTTQIHSSAASERAGVATVDMKLEVVVVPVSDVDRAKQFYAGLGWRLDGQADANWPDWYAEYRVREHAGEELPT